MTTEQSMGVYVAYRQGRIEAAETRHHRERLEADIARFEGEIADGSDRPYLGACLRQARLDLDRYNGGDRD